MPRILINSFKRLALNLRKQLIKIKNKESNLPMIQKSMWKLFKKKKSNNIINFYFFFFLGKIKIYEIGSRIGWSNSRIKYCSNSTRFIQRIYSTGHIRISNQASGARKHRHSDRRDQPAKRIIWSFRFWTK